MKWYKTGIVLLATFGFASCGGKKPGDDISTHPELTYTVYKSSIERNPSPDIQNNEYVQLAADNNRFAIKFFQDQFNPSANGSIFSPYSISSALAMTYAGASGDTQAEMAGALEYNLEPQTLHAGFNRSLVDLNLRNLLKSPSHPALELLITNALWPSVDGFPAKPFLDTLASQYGAGVYALDYAQQPEESRQAINNQVEQWTKGYITDLLPKNSIDTTTRLVITSSMYLFAPWEDSFPTNNTSPRPFYNLNGLTVDIPTMSASAGASYGQTEDADFGSLFFRDGALQMLFILPTGDFTSYVESFNEVKFMEGISQMQYATGVVQIPKFEFESDNSVVDSLKKLGMHKAFNSEADFSPMGLGDVYIGDIRHKAVIQVNEAGTTAAAATAVLILPPSIPPKVLIVNRPFIYMVFDRITNTILFMGHIANL